MGIESFIGKINFMILGVEISIIPLLIGIILIIVVGNSTYKIFEKFLIFLVSMMSLTFIVLAILSKPNVSEIIKGLVPSVDNNNFIYVIGLIGTTVVPYNLFLHSYVARDKWKSKSDYKKSLADTIISIMIGGIISLSIIITSASSQSLSSSEIKNAIDLGNQLSPLMGSFSKFLYLWDYSVLDSLHLLPRQLLHHMLFQVFLNINLNGKIKTSKKYQL